jgi:ATP-dependent DNA helicase RecG
MGITTIGDVLFWKPRSYLDGSQVAEVSTVKPGETVAMKLTVQSLKQERVRGGRLPLLTVIAGDETGDITLQWFNQTYLAAKLAVGSEWVVMGKVGFFKGKKVLASPRLEDSGRIIPRYPQTKLVTSTFLSKLAVQALRETEVGEILPEEVRVQRQLLSLKEALQFLHTPTHMDEVGLAQATLSVCEAWQFFRSLTQPEEASQVAGKVVPADAAFLAATVAQLPFELTAGQKRVVWDAALQMQQGKVMTRLLNGDVGSGKTVVASLLACLVAKAGFQSVFIAPTEILAEQHYLSIGKLFQAAGLRVALWTGSKKDEAAILEADLVVGTHALLNGGYRSGEVAFVVIDEQHRFGVRQRSLLRDLHAVPPHVLSMTATPIPRSLALTLFAGLEVSFLRDKPVGRQAIATSIIGNASARSRMEQHIEAAVAEGRQVFVVCPAITEKPEDEEEVMSLFTGSMGGAKKAVEQEVVRLQERFPKLRIGMVHGKLPPKKKEAMMTAMAAGEVDILVATSVVEVGVDVPNATILVVENAEQFGLAQLHQLRGRVGRSSHASSCYLVSSGGSSLSRERLQVLVDTDDGFAIAEADLAQRGPGDLAGISQAGLPAFHFASLARLDELVEVRDMLRSYEASHPEYKLMEDVPTYSGLDVKLE